MALTNHAKYRKELKRTIIKFVKFYVIGLTGLIVGVFGFYYLEHCYDPVLPPDPQKDYREICQYINTTILHNDNTVKTLCKEGLGLKKVEMVACKLDLKTFWKYWDYTISVAFTTGFGRVVPLSRSGKIATIIYTMPSIALTMTCYMYAGQIITITLKMTILAARKKLLKIKHDRYFANQVFFCQFSLTVLLWFCYALQDRTVYPDRSLLDSLYYGMITLSTVGFGDFSHNTEKIYETGIHYFFINMFFFLFAMGSIAATIGEMQNILADSPSVEGETRLQEQIEYAEQQVLGNIFTLSLRNDTLYTKKYEQHLKGNHKEPFTRIQNHLGFR